MFVVYVLQSELDGRLYKGHTDRLEQRIKEHNLGKIKSTKGYRPWRLVYKEEYKTRIEAVKRERYLKSGVGRQFLQGLLKNKAP